MVFFARTWTDDRIQSVKVQWVSGTMSASEIGETMGCSRSAILGLIHRQGITGPRTGKHFAVPGIRKGQVTSPIGRAAKKLGITRTELVKRICKALDDELISIILDLDDEP